MECNALSVCISRGTYDRLHVAKLLVRLHPKCQNRADEQQTDAANKGQLPISSFVDHVAENNWGEIAARADPVFIRPLAEPENFGAMSIGMAHIGPIVNSAKKNARLKQMAAKVRLCVNTIGTMKAREQRNPKTTRLRRALSRLRVFSKTRSLIPPPRVSPTTPAKKTP